MEKAAACSERDPSVLGGLFRKRFLSGEGGIFRVNLPGPQAGTHGGAEQPVQHRGDGRAEENAGNAQHTAPEHHGKQGPQRGQPNGRAHHPGVDHISLHLLENQQEHQEDKGVDGVDQEKDHHTHGRADVGA